MAGTFRGVTKNILLYLALAGALTIVAAAPGTVLALKLFKKRKETLTAKEFQKRVSDAFYHLRKSRLVILQERKDGVFVVELSEAGKRKVKEIQFGQLSIQKPKHWDRVWRIVIFDIPNKRRAARDFFRKKLQEWNFYQLQESVWVCPYPCAREIEFLAELLQISPFVNSITAANIRNDVKLRAHFKLF